MKSWNPCRLATLLVAVVALVVGLAIMPAHAHHCKGSHFFPGCVPAGGGGGGEPDAKCAMAFRGVLDNTLLRVLSDGLGPYIDGALKVQFTSSTNQNKGRLRFDTNAIAKVEKPQDVRKVTLNFTDAISDPVTGLTVLNEVGFVSELKGIDLRFDATDGVGLDLCSLGPGDSGHVVINIVFLTGDGEDYALSYGCRLAIGVEPDDGDLSKAVVTRTVDPTPTWTIEGVSACLRDGPSAYYPRIDLDGGGFDPDDDQILMPFRIVLEALP